MLDKDTLKQRIDAARTLRGYTQAELSALAAEEGHGKYELARMERGELTLTKAMRRTLVEILRVPDEWFTDPELDLRGVTRPAVARLPEPTGELGRRVEGDQPDAQDRRPEENLEDGDAQTGTGE